MGDGVHVEDVCYQAEDVPGDVEEEQTLQLQVLDFGCEVRPVALRRKETRIYKGARCSTSFLPQP